MASWSELLGDFQKIPDKSEWIFDNFKKKLSKISEIFNDANVIFYASAFLQKKNIPEVSIDSEDINGFMNALYQAQTEKDLILILHTPGGNINAVETIVDYLHSKFKNITVIVPYLAMSGGAMISLASDSLILGKQSQLGPIDPQLTRQGKSYSARAIREGFGNAKKDIENNTKLGHLWAPILQQMGPSLIIEAKKALDYSKELIIKWLNQRMFKDIKEPKRKTMIENIVKYFNAEKTEEFDTIHVHGQRINIQKLKELKLKVQSLEENQDLQEATLEAYHIMTIMFENTPAFKFIISNNGNKWLKNQQHPQRQPQQIIVPSNPKPS